MSCHCFEGVQGWIEPHVLRKLHIRETPFLDSCREARIALRRAKGDCRFGRAFGFIVPLSSSRFLLVQLAAGAGSSSPRCCSCSRLRFLS